MIDFEDLYFEWMCGLVNDSENKSEQYKVLLRYLYNSDFIWTLPMDANREDDGLSLRYVFADIMKISHPMIEEIFARKNVSILEMMVALAVRTEDDIMADPKYGRRVPVWFWAMIDSLNLSEQYDHVFDESYCSFVLNRLINHEYRADGFGGLFYIPNYKGDLRQDEIWVQLNKWLHNFV